MPILVLETFSCQSSASAVAEVTGSEWGMQDEGRASYDANSIADEVRAHIAEITIADLA